MKRFFKINKQMVHLLGLLSLLVMLAPAVTIKERDIRNSTGVQNPEVTYHALLTIEFLLQNSIRDNSPKAILTWQDGRKIALTEGGIK